ncbi:YeeE/YedE family protein [Tropicibacter naphthalenivorans]|uniref:Putative inner membrane protein n=1 Tax=Tropicibacter naphthalenivorans TaxID=441103 RepID=A0A0P1GB93_9RHOB|nr:YeeE/YedE family protein [Tropicibacter naphthalenivorans]CUH78720.1 putative inner membrane protein [Tropicibacter naphthalenivorans]SMC81320.1 Sulphur transport [Tropicibacter naphthalenivorans]
MDIVPLIDRIGESPTAALFGLITGVIFGVAAQRSRFCLRAATVEFARGMMRDKVAVWLLTFSTAVVWVQGAQMLGLIDTGEARMMAVPGSWSGAIIGGLLFGMGMVLARGCSGRLLVLAATGNLRSVVSGLIFAVVAQMSLTGWLSPIRDYLAALWITSGGRNMNLLTTVGLPQSTGLVIGLLIALIALELSRRNRIGFGRLVFASGVGFAAAVGYGLTFALAQSAFEPVQVESLTFTGPSANTLMFFLDRNAVLEFDIGLVPGVVLGSFLAALVTKELKFQGFEGPTPMRNAMIGAVMMGFGGMLAGGCAIGAGVSGGSIFAGTAWLALFCMWVGGMAMDVVMGGRGQPATV